MDEAMVKGNGFGAGFRKGFMLNAEKKIGKINNGRQRQNKGDARKSSGKSSRSVLPHESKNGADDQQATATPSESIPEGPQHAAQIEPRQQARPQIKQQKKSSKPFRKGFLLQNTSSKAKIKAKKTTSNADTDADAIQQTRQQQSKNHKGDEITTFAAGPPPSSPPKQPRRKIQVTDSSLLDLEDKTPNHTASKSLLLLEPTTLESSRGNDASTNRLINRSGNPRQNVLIADVGSGDMATTGDGSDSREATESGDVDALLTPLRTTTSSSLSAAEAESQDNLLSNANEPQHNMIGSTLVTVAPHKPASVKDSADPADPAFMTTTSTTMLNPLSQQFITKHQRRTQPTRLQELENAFWRLHAKSQNIAAASSSSPPRHQHDAIRSLVSDLSTLEDCQWAWMAYHRQLTQDTISNHPSSSTTLAFGMALLASPSTQSELIARFQRLADTPLAKAAKIEVLQVAVLVEMALSYRNDGDEAVEHTRMWTQSTRDALILEWFGPRLAACFIRMLKYENHRKTVFVRKLVKVTRGALDLMSVQGTKPGSSAVEIKTQEEVESPSALLEALNTIVGGMT